MVGEGAAVLGDEGGGREAVERDVGVAFGGVDVGAWADLKVEVREVGSFGGADGADLLATLDDLAEFDADFFEVGIHGLYDGPQLVVCGQAVGEDDHFSPSRAGLAGVNDAASPGGEDGIAEVGVFSAYAVEVVAKVA